MSERGYSECTRVINRVGRGYNNDPKLPRRVVVATKANFFDASHEWVGDAPGESQRRRSVTLDSSRGVTAQAESG